MVSERASNAVSGSQSEKLLSRQTEAEAAVNAEVGYIARGVMDDLAGKYGRAFALEVVREILVALVELAMLDAEGTS